MFVNEILDLYQYTREKEKLIEIKCSVFSHGRYKKEILGDTGVMEVLEYEQ